MDFNVPQKYSLSILAIYNVCLRKTYHEQWNLLNLHGYAIHRIVPIKQISISVSMILI